MSPAFARGSLPRWVVLVVGVLAVLVGATLIFRPFASLAVLRLLVVVGLVVLALAELSEDPQSADRRAARLKALGWAAAALVVLLWPGLSLKALAVVVGVALVLDGVGDVLGALRRTTSERLAALIHGIAGVLLGVLALAWPDITVTVVAVLFGLRLAWFGVTTVWASVRPRPVSQLGAGRGRPAPGLLLRSWHVLRALVALAVVLVLLGVSSKLHGGSPQPDEFYSAPSDVPDTPGQLLRSEPFSRAVSAGAQAWRILYTTTRDEGEPAVASALVVAPAEPPAGPLPVIAWAHGTTGVAEGCAPSLLEDPFAAGATPALDEVVERGWVMVATDYVGLGTDGPHPYLIGQGEGRSVLDAVRAARQLDELTLEDKTVVWGHSQGGNAALWAGQLAPSYAPDADVIAVAALAPASDLRGLVSNLDVVPGGSIFGSYVISAYDERYDDVDLDSYVRPEARIQVREMAGRCLAEPEVFVSIITSMLFDKSVWSRDPASGAAGERLAENTPTGAIDVPLLIGQGEADALVLPSTQAAYVEGRCEAGGQVDYRTYPGFDHVGVVGDDSPLVTELLQWTQDRLDGKPATPTC